MIGPSSYGQLERLLRQTTDGARGMVITKVNELVVVEAD